MARRVLACTAVVLVLGAACNESRISGEADVAISGTVQRQDGSAVANTSVALMKEPDAADVFNAVVSIGLTCLELEFSECGETRSVESGPDGAFAYQLEGADTQGRYGNASIMELTTLLSHSDDELAGPGLSTRFQVQSEKVSVPLRAWEPELEIEGAARNVHFGWTEPPRELFPAEADLGRMQRWIVFEGADGELIWRATGAVGGADLDARILEDTRGGATVFATVGDIKTRAERGTDVEVLARSARLPYASTAGAPLSRGKPCSVPGADGKPVAQSPCVPTDGRFGEEFRPATCPSGDEACTEPDHEQVSIDLGSPASVALVVIRGCAGTCVVDGSTDGRAWTKLGANASDSLRPRDVAMPVNATSARFVRVTSSEDVKDVREISVWDPTAPSVKGSLVVPPASVPKGALTGGGGGSGRSILWLLVAAALVVLTVVGALVLRSRRKTSAPGSS